MRSDKFKRPYWERELTVNAPILLWREAGQVDIGNWRYRGEVRAELHFWPEPRVLVVLDLPNGLTCPQGDGEVVFALPSGERRMAALLVENWCSTNRGGRVVLHSEEGWDIGDSAEAVPSIGFGIANFPPFRAGVILNDENGESRRVEEIQLQAGEWLITIVPAAMATEQYRQLYRQGGYAVTAIGSISRSDELSLGFREIEPLLDEVRFFLSFVLGRWAGSLRPSGLDRNGDVVWECGGFPPLLDHGVERVNWFFPDHADCLSSVFQGFDERWKDADAKEAIRFAIYWYVTATSGARGVEGRLVMSVAGLEVLAFWVLVKDRKIWSKKAYKEESLAGRLRKLFQVVGLPVELSLMGEFKRRFPWPHSWTDGPEALARMRNNLMHADKERQETAYQSGWWLSQWYLELCLLWTFRYRGTYLDRRNLDAEPVPVPWASQEGIGTSA